MWICAHTWHCHCSINWSSMSLKDMTELSSLIIGFPAHLCHLCIQFHQFPIQFRSEKLTAFESKVLLGLYTWETNLTETLTNMNADRRNCLVLSYCDRRIWIAIDENWWQSTKLNDNVSKLIDQRRNWNEHSHIPECPGRNWKHIF